MYKENWNGSQEKTTKVLHLVSANLGKRKESWTITKSWRRDSKLKKCTVFQKNVRILWLQKVTKVVVLKKMKTKRQLMDTIREKQWRFVGHLLREDDRMEPYIKKTELVGKRARKKAEDEDVRLDKEENERAEGQRFG